MTKVPSRRPVFVRETTGLVKSANVWEASAWNVVNMMGNKFPWSVARLGLFPAGLILGWPPYLWTVLLVGLATYVLGIVCVQITSAMPRSGAEYVIPSRLIGPLWGWIESWMLVCALVPLWGWSTWVTVRNIKQVVDIIRIGGLTTVSVPWILDGAPALSLGILLICAAIMICFLPSKKYYRLIGVLGIMAVLSLFVMAAGGAMVSRSIMDANMQRLFGSSSSSLVQTAIQNGFDPNEQVDFASAAVLCGLVLFGFEGFQYSATISGELKGKTSRTLLVSILGSLTFFLILYMPFVWFFLSRFDYNLVVAWSYLFWNNSANAPLRLPPINALLLTVAMPDLSLIWAVAGVASIIGAWLFIPASMLFVNRIALYWGIDRMAPSFFAEVNPKFGQPLKLVAVEGILAGVSYGLVLWKVNPVVYLWWSTLLMFPAFLFPAISALMLPRRYPELVHFVPWRRWLAPLAILWVIFIVPFYVFAGFIGSVPPLTSRESIWQYASSSGLILTGLVVLAGLLVFGVARAYNLRRGIDIGLISKSIPPE